jgi:sterol 14-demethylase
LLGSLIDFIRDPIVMLQRGYQAHGEVFGFRLGRRDFWVFAGPEAHDAFFRVDGDILSAREVYRFTVPIFGRGIAYDTTPEIMEQQLGFLFPALRDGPMRRYVRLMQEEITAYTRNWGEAGEVDLPAMMNELTTLIACRCLLGEEVRNALYAGFGEHYHALQSGINLVGLFAPRLPIPAHRRRDRARREIVSLIGGVVAERRRTGHRAEDFLQALIDARYADSRVLRDDEITGLLLTVLFAGQHTSGVLAAWTGIELMHHPQAMDSVVAEVDAACPHELALDFDALKKHVLLDCAVHEAERLHPPLILLIRKVLREFRYRHFRFPAGSLAVVSPALSHRLPDVFPDPEQYDLARFAAPREEHKQHRYALITFGGGKHRCMGSHFAYLQVKALWAALLHGFDWAPVTPPPSPDYANWVTGPKAPCRVRFRRRKSLERNH